MSENRKNPEKTALIVEGGAMRGIFANGVLHAFGLKKFDPFDLYMGVSAGACSLASHLAEQNTRNYEIMERWFTNKRAINFWRFLRGGHYIDLDWIWDVTIDQYRLDLETLFAKNKEFVIVATSMKTGQAMYLKPDASNVEHYMKVSSALPLFYRSPLKIEGELAVDGGLSDAIPVKECQRRGAKQIVVIRSRNINYVKKPSKTDALAAWHKRKTPELSRAIKTRVARYNESLDFMKAPPKGIKVHQIAPPQDFQTSRTTTNIDILRKDYQKGIEAGLEAIDILFKTDFADKDQEPKM